MAYLFVAILLTRFEIDVSLRFLAPAWILINCLDAHSTWLFLKNGHREGNFLASWLFDKIGLIPSFILVKIPIAFLLLYLAYRNKNYKKPLLACVIVFGFVVIINYWLGTT